MLASRFVCAPAPGMVSILANLDWSLRSLGDEDRNRLLAFLGQDPILNVYLISRILDDGVTGGGTTVEVLGRGKTVCVASMSSNLVMARARDASEQEVEKALTLVAGRILTRALPIRAIISEAALVEHLWSQLANRFDPPSVVRLNQPVYVLEDLEPPLPDLRRLRYSELRDLDLLVPACAAMHKEEIGIDPLDRDAAGYRLRVRELIERRRSLVLAQGGKIVFKCEFSAVTPEVVQLMGVWTAPAYRRRRFASEALEEVIGHIVRQGKRVTLFVNDFNRPAIRLYESLGFRRIATNRALIW